MGLWESITMHYLISCTIFLPMRDLQILLFSLPDSPVQRRSAECQLCKGNASRTWIITLKIYNDQLQKHLHNDKWEFIKIKMIEMPAVNQVANGITKYRYISTTRKYYPSSKEFRDPPTYTHQPSMQQKVPFSLIRCSSSKVAFCSCVEWGWHIYNIVESESDPLTRRAVDLFEKEPLKGNSEVHLHTPTKFGEDRSKDLGGDREQTDRQTNRQTLLDL